MTKENADALKVLTNTINRLADEAVDQADYDRTRNARVIEVVRDITQYGQPIVGYKVDVDGKQYDFKKDSGKGIIVNENDVVKMHIPCNNMNNAYLSYPHDPENYIKTYENTQYGFRQVYSRGKRETIGHINIDVTFPATTKQFSSYEFVIDGESFGMTGIDSTVVYDFIVGADNDVIATMVNSNYKNQEDLLVVKLRNENPDAINPVTKNVNVIIHAIKFQYL
jgi:hypothetical protein